MNLYKKIAMLMLFASHAFLSESFEDYCVKKTDEQFNSVFDYQVDMIVKLDIPAFRMPKKKYKVYFKQPNKIKVKATGLACFLKLDYLRHQMIILIT